MFDLLTKLRALRSHLAAGDYLAAARLVHEIVGIFLQPQPVGSAEAEDLDAIQAEWKCCEEDIAAAKPPAQLVGAPAGFDPTFWLMLVQTFGPIIAEWIRRRRQGG
jgi:hypothetical protein